ncbi:putative F-box/LRR-repeat protein At3g18150 [Brachypodium distachyon]|uniref:putative F-box/LRR-repeat protein At3g18150 n=1 Tax=Brachypodium distachyon TaxID=15368 RepID=UPI0001D43B28|nr:putative F-box/LRR-repeat protein At3g18150 [Brachypodium distachyon]|eukprot:XP_010237094.1 putative F-box/LRR-repeat protein At3g18150 [Brachypodium distachyon]
MAMEMGPCGPIPKRSRPASVSPSTGVGELVGVDRISDLPDVILGEIVSLLPLDEGARTQILASRWRRIWRCYAPLNLDFCAPLVARTRRRRRRRGRGLRDDELAGLISRILSSHQGTGRRFCVHSSFRFSNQAATVEAWLQSAALDNLQELNLWHTNERLPDYLPLPRSAVFRFSTTLRVATIAHCKLPDSTVQGLQFAHLKQLGLKQVLISEHSMHHIIAACPALECLMIERIFGFCCVRINSLSLRSIGVGTGISRTNELQVVELVVDNAPCLKRLLHLQMDACLDMHIAVISAPKLETFRCCLSQWASTRFGVGSAPIQRDGTLMA